MARAARDENSTTALLGTSNSDGQTPLPVYVDSATNRLLVQATISGSLNANTEYTEGDTDTTITGIASMAEGPSNTLTPLQVDSDKRLQVDIAADSVGIGGGIQYDEGDTDASITGTVALMEVGSDTLQPIQGTVADGLLVNLGSNNDVTVSGTVTAELSATDNAVLDAIAASVADVDTNTDGIEALLTTIDADTSNLSVVGGGTEAAAIRVTIANDSTGVVSIDDNGGNISIDDGGNTITVDGTVAVTNTGLTELAAAINSDKVDVNIASSDISFGGTSAADDADFTDGTTPGTPAMGVYESTPTTVTDGDLGVVGITETRRLKTSATVDAALPAGTNNIGDVDVLSSALPTGASTSAKQDTVIGHLDGVEGLLTTIDGDTGNISTKIDTLAGAVSGTEVQVDVLSSALPTGASTLAEQQSQTTHLATIAGDTTDIETAVELIDDTVYVDDADWTDNTSKHILVGGVYQATPHTVTDGDVTPFLTDENGRLAVEATLDTTGLATEAKQDTIIGHVDGVETLLGTIDTDTGNIVTSVQLLDDTVFAEDVAAQAADKGVAILAVRRDADTSLVGTDNDYANLQVDANGYLKVEIFDGGGSHTVDGTVTAELSATDNAVLDAIEADTTTIAGAVSGSEMQVDVVAALPAGTNAIGKLAANSGVDIGDVDVTSIAAGTNAIGDVGLIPRTSGGLSIHRSLDLDESEEEVKATAGQVYGVWFTNNATTTRWLKFYNDTAANVSVGTTTPAITIGLPGNTSDDISGSLNNGGQGIPFSTAICAAVTTGLADNDTGAPSANDVVINIFYK